MIFRPPLVRAILAGRKTATRRIPKPRETECRYQPGRSYAVQPGRGKPEVARILILEVEMKPLMQFGYHDARREGFLTQRDFFDYWLSLYGHVNTDLHVWVINFQLEQDAARFLTPAARPRGTVRGYTTKERDALELVEVVPPMFQESIADEARDRYAIVHAEELAKREGRSLANQLREAHARAALRGVDVTPEIQAIRQQLEQIRNKLGNAA